MGIRLSQHKSRLPSSPLFITVTPRLPDPPNSSDGASLDLVWPDEGHNRTRPLKPSLAHASSKTSVLSESSCSSDFLKGGKRKVSFDLLAEMAYVFPDEPLSPVLVELAPDGDEEGAGQGAGQGVGQEGREMSEKVEEAVESESVVVLSEQAPNQNVIPLLGKSPSQQC